MVKRGKIIVLLSIFVLLFLTISLVSSVPNKVKTFDPNNGKYGTITITNNSGDLIEMELLDNTDYCTNYCFANISGKSFKNINLFENLTFDNKKGEDVTINNYSIKIIDNKGKEIKSKKHKGEFNILIEGWKNPLETADWIMNALGFYLKEWFFWNSWQDWNDDFEDSDVNQTIWYNQSSYCAFGGGCSPISDCLYYVSEESAVDGFVDVHSETLLQSAGELYGVWARLLTKQDYNDSRDYSINFSMNGSIATAMENNMELIVTNNSDLGVFGGSCSSIGLSPNRQTIHDFTEATLEIPLQNYSISIEGTNFSLFNDSADSHILLSSVTLTGNKWYIGFETANRGSGAGNHGTNLMYIYNFTSSSKDNIQITLNTPTDNSHTNQTSTINCSATSGGNEFQNVTIKIWNSTSYLVNSSSETLSGLSNSTSNSFTFDLEATYSWNCLWYNNNNFSSSSSSNFTHIVNNTIAPNISVENINTVKGSQTFTFNVSTNDSFPGLSTCWYNVLNSSGGVEIGNTTFPCNTQVQDTVTSFETYTLNSFSNDSSNNNNTNSTTENFTIEESEVIVVGGGGGGGTIEPETIVVALVQPEDIFRVITEKERAIVYARMREFCPASNCILSEPDKMELKTVLEGNSTKLALEEVGFFLGVFNDGLIENVAVKKTDFELFRLFAATITVSEIPFTISNQRLDRFWIVTGSPNLTTIITANKKIAACNVLHGDVGWTCVPRDSFVELQYTLKTFPPEFDSRVVKVQVQYTSFEGDVSIQEAQIRMFNLNTVLIISGILVVFIGIIIFMSFSKSKAIRNFRKRLGIK